MSGFRKLNQRNLQQLLISLREGFPHTKEFYQIGREVINGGLKANLYVDSWPNFSTIISQEFNPRLSTNSDIRLYTTNKENIWQVIDNAKLLDDTGDFQLVLYRTQEEDGEPLTSYLLNGFKSHPRTSLKKYEVVFDYYCYSISDDIPVEKVSLPKGFSMRKLSPDTAEFIARYWLMSDLIDMPKEYFVQFLRDTLLRSEILGIYEDGNEEYPVAWTGTKCGGELGLSHTLENYRNHKFFFILRNAIMESCKSRGNCMIVNTNFSGARGAFGHEFIGRSRYICIS